MRDNANNNCKVSAFGLQTLLRLLTTFEIVLCHLISNRTGLTMILFLARGVIAGLFQAAYVYTPEVYPTALRSVGVGGCSALARLGAMATPYVAQVLLQTSLTSAVTVYGIFAVSACIACMLLPYETRGTDMAA